MYTLIHQRDNNSKYVHILRILLHEMQATLLHASTLAGTSKTNYKILLEKIHVHVNLLCNSNVNSTIQCKL